MSKTQVLTKSANGFFQKMTIPFRLIMASKHFRLLLLLMMSKATIFAQGDGVAALEEAADTIASYYDPVVTVVYSMAAIIALMGAVRVYLKWTSGDQNVMGAAAGWFGSAIFLVIAITIAQSFFG